MESDVQFKAYYRDEIRRFNLKDGQSLNYACLAQRIQTVFDIPPTFQLRLRWLDNEGDKIAFSCSSELTDAVLLMTAMPRAASVLKIFVSAKSDDTADCGSTTTGSSAFNQGDIRHPGVTCDGCQTNIRGYRFKCITCPDYDLCVTCLNQDIHSQHQMLLIRRPGDHLFGDGWGGFGGFGGCGGWRGSWHPMRRFRQRQQQQCQQQEQEQEHQQNPATQACGSTTEFKTASTASGGSPASVDSEQLQQQQLIEHVTSAINTFLKPLGIDASIQVVHQTGDAEVQARPAAQQPPPAEASVKASLLTEAQRVSSVQPRPAQSESHAVFPPPVLDTTNVAFAAAADRQESASALQAARLNSSTAAFNAASAYDNFAGDFEFVGDRSPPRPSPPPMDPKIARALEHMTAMGFSDDGGWLTRLLTAKDGDICAVLDAIRPATK